MLGFIFKKRFVHTALTNPLIKFNALHSPTALNSSIPVQSDLKGDAFTISYLTNSCGLAADAAQRIANYFCLKSADKPSQTLNFFKSCGFTDSQISGIIRVAPKVLLADPDKTLKPKFDLFVSLGAPREAVLKLISKCPRILTTSVENKIIPALDCLKSVGGSVEEVLTLLAGSHRRLVIAPTNALEQNVAALRKVGMSDANIWRFVFMNGYSPLTPPDKFKDLVERASVMGFDPKKHNFGDAMNSFATVSEASWDRKVSIFKKWGWLDEEFLRAFKKQPRIMVVSEEKLVRIMEYLVNTMGIEASVISCCPNVLKYSLEKRIVPRCSVVQILLSKGVIQKNEYSISSVVTLTNDEFILSFVERYKEIRDELLSVYSQAQAKAVTKQDSFG